MKFHMANKRIQGWVPCLRQDWSFSHLPGKQRGGVTSCPLPQHEKVSSIHLLLRKTQLLVTYGQQNQPWPHPCHFNYALAVCWRRPPGTTLLLTTTGLLPGLLSKEQLLLLTAGGVRGKGWAVGIPISRASYSFSGNFLWRTISKKAEKHIWHLSVSGWFLLLSLHFNLLPGEHWYRRTGAKHRVARFLLTGAKKVSHPGGTCAGSGGGGRLMPGPPHWAWSVHVKISSSETHPGAPQPQDSRSSHNTEMNLQIGFSIKSHNCLLPHVVTTKELQWSISK